MSESEQPELPAPILIGEERARSDTIPGDSDCHSAPAFRHPTPQNAPGKMRI